MLGEKELERLNTQREALIAESDVNRLTLQVEIQNLCSATTLLKEVVGRPGKVAPWLLLLGPLAALLFRRKARESSSWFSRALAAAKWLGPLYTVWKGFMAGRAKAEGSHVP